MYVCVFYFIFIVGEKKRDQIYKVGNLSMLFNMETRSRIKEVQVSLMIQHN